LAVVARRDRGIASARDLAGRRIGLTLGTSGEYFLWALFIGHKLRPDSVTLVDVPPGEFEKSIVAGTVDAVATWEPNVRKVQLALGENAVVIHDPLAYTETFNVIGHREYLKQHPRVVEKLLRAALRSEKLIRSQPDEALSLVSERLQIDLESLKHYWTNFDFHVDLLQSQLVTLEEQARWAMARGYSEKASIPNFLPNFYLDALLAVRPERVTVAR
jgi:NitT/TauT family transport system substrate-binding protein